MGLRKIEHAFSYDIEASDTDFRPTNREIGELMTEFCESARLRCAKAGNCVIGAVSNVHGDIITVNLRCSAGISNKDNLEHCAVAQRTAKSIDESLSDFLLVPEE